MLFRELIFLNYTNQPAQVTCLSLLFRTPKMFVSSSDIVSSDFVQTPDNPIWRKLIWNQVPFRTLIETPPQKNVIYYSHYWIWAFYRKACFCALSLLQWHCKAFGGESSDSGLAYCVNLVAPNLHQFQWEKNLIQHPVLTEAGGKTDFSTSWSCFKL